MIGVTKKVAILADLYFKHKGDNALSDFFEYNNIGLPLAYVVQESLATLQPRGEQYISETYAMLIESLGASHEEDYASLEDLFAKFST